MNGQRNKKIGLLGGIGPEATGNFYLDLISRLQASGQVKENRDFPQIIVNSINAPELIGEKVSEKDMEPYLFGLKELEKFDVDFIFMVCNTIHLFYTTLQKKIKVPILDLRSIFERFLRLQQVKSIVVFGTPMTIKSGLYKYEGIKYVEPSEKDSKLLSQLIFNFNKGLKQAPIINNLANKYLRQGAEFLITGCTEIALMLKNSDIPKIDPMDLVIEEIVSLYLH